MKKKTKLKLYRLTQSVVSWRDSYYSCIVCAESAEDAVTISPNGKEMNGKADFWYGSWPSNVADVDCEEIGNANSLQVRGVILASFNAG